MAAKGSIKTKNFRTPVAPLEAKRKAPEGKPQCSPPNMAGTEQLRERTHAFRVHPFSIKAITAILTAPLVLRGSLRRKEEIISSVTRHLLLSSRCSPQRRVGLFSVAPVGAPAVPIATRCALLAVSGGGEGTRE